jgi:iron complex outermembrane receptor protein
MQKMTLSLLLGLLATGVVAQVETSTSETTIENPVEGTDNRNENQDVERVEVTGSLIKRVDVEGPAAVQTFDKEYIEKSGWNNLGDMMRDLAANSLGVAADSAGSSSPASQTANLGGLGASRTLVLIDGRRAPKDGSLGAFDLSLMPMGAIERFDIMSDAGSALYGTDAIGGVINIITKKDFNGFEFSTSHFQPEQEGGGRTTVSMTYGKSAAKGNFTTSFTVRNNQKIQSKDRKLTNIGDSFNAPSANYQTGGNFGGNVDGTCAGNDSAYVAGDFCRYKYNDIKDETPDVKQVSNITNFSYDLTSDLTFFGTTLASYKDTQNIYAPGVVALSVNSATIDSYNLPGHTAGEDVNIFWRSAQLGNRISNSEEKVFGGNVGLKTYIGDTWEVSAIVGADKSLRENTNPLGYSNQAKLIELMENGTINPFTNTGVIPDSVRENPFHKVGSEAIITEVRATGEISDGWAGPIGMAVGAGYTYESINIEIDSQSKANNVTGGGASSDGKGNRNSQFAVAEIMIPAAKGLEIQAATRFDNYDTFGETFNPKLGIAYRPFTKLLLRASAGTGFKAPGLTSLYSGSEGYPSFYDFQTDNSNQYKTSYISNPDLQPETSTNITVGAVVEPFQGLSFSVDYISNKMNDQIATPSVQDINDDEAEFGTAFVEKKYQVIANRGADGGPNYIIKPINTHEVINQRIQVGVKATKHFNSIGTLSLTNDTSYMFKYTEQVFESDEVEDLFTGTGVPRWRNNARLSYAPTRSLSFDTTLTTTGSSFKEQGEIKGKFNMYTRIDLAANIGLFNNSASLRVGVQDLTGENPPHDRTANTVTVSSLYDYTGTRFFAAYRQTF